VTQLVEYRASNRKVAKPWFDSRCGSASLCPWEIHLMLFPILRPSSQPVEDMQTEQLLCWSGMTDTEYATSGSSE